MGDVTMYYSLLTDPDWIHDYCRVYTDFHKQYFAYLFEHVGLPDGIWMYEDLGYKNGLFASPKVMAELIFPYFTELVSFFHSYDLPVVLHTCGSTAKALPMIVEAGFDALNPMERKAKDNDLRLCREVRRQAGLCRRVRRAGVGNQRQGADPPRDGELHRRDEGPRRAAGLRLRSLHPADGGVRYLPVCARGVPRADDVLT